MALDERQIDEWAERLEAAASLLRSKDGRLQRLIERDRHGLTPDGMGGSGGDGRVSGGDRSDPTVSAVLALTSDDDRTAEDKARSRGQADYIHRCASGALRSIKSASDDAWSFVGLIRESERMEVKAKTRPGAVGCAERWCEDEAAAGREGRCEPCYRWRKRWKDDHPTETLTLVPPVPKEVIEQRRIRRLRVHEDGRMVS